VHSIGINSYSELVQTIHNLFHGDGWVVCYLDYKVLIGKYESGSLVFYAGEQFDPLYLQQLRVFNESLELLMLRNASGQFNYRLKSDEEGGEEYIEAKQILWGTRIEKLDNDWIRLSEDRGTELIMPRPQQPNDRIKLLTRNYIGFNEVGQAGYIDCRFVKFE